MDKILLLENDRREEQPLLGFLEDVPCDVLLARDDKAARLLLAHTPDIIILNMAKPARNNGRTKDRGVLPDNGNDNRSTVLHDAHRLLPEIPIIVVSWEDSVGGAVETMKQGASEFLLKPVGFDRLLVAIQRATEQSQRQGEVHRLRQQVEEGGGLLDMVGNSPSMHHVFEQIQLVALARSTVLITGESGTGKELVAKAIHRLSPRKDGPFVAISCAAIPRDLAESELFGHAKGAFTGATEQHVGKFALADRGTLLIDEIGEMELPIQAKLLRTLETLTISPIGSNDEQVVDVRVVAATHRNLRSLVDEGKFRQDLYYRLHVICIELPALRERGEDISLLAASFLAQLNAENNSKISISPDAIDSLQHHAWPGNVRELRNVLEQVVVLSQKDTIKPADLPVEIEGSKVRQSLPRFFPGVTLAELEREAIQQCLLHTRGSRRQAAKLLGISTRTLLRKIRQYRLEDPRRRAPAASS